MMIAVDCMMLCSFLVAFACSLLPSRVQATQVKRPMCVFDVQPHLLMMHHVHARRAAEAAVLATHHMERDGGHCWLLQLLSSCHWSHSRADAIDRSSAQCFPTASEARCLGPVRVHHGGLSCEARDWCCWLVRRQSMATAASALLIWSRLTRWQCGMVRMQVRGPCAPCSVKLGRLLSYPLGRAIRRC